MRALRLMVCGLVLFSLAFRRADPAGTAFRAQALLGSGVWSRVLRINNNQPGKGSHYPAKFYGLIFAFEGMRWLYTELDGTQSLSQIRGRLAADKANPGPLLLAIEPGLTVFKNVTGQNAVPANFAAGPLPYDCFILSVARWLELLREANPPERARLLACYMPSIREGHTLIEYWRDGRRFVFNPWAPRWRKTRPWNGSDDPVELARAIFPPDITPGPDKVMALELHPAGPWPGPPQITVNLARPRGRMSLTF